MKKDRIFVSLERSTRPWGNIRFKVSILAVHFCLTVLDFSKIPARIPLDSVIIIIIIMLIIIIITALGVATVDF